MVAADTGNPPPMRISGVFVLWYLKAYMISEAVLPKTIAMPLRKSCTQAGL